MRTIKYREILWGAAYRLGMDPAKELLSDQADALASYVNGWVRRLYDAQDWPEWTKIIRYTVDPVTNLVPYTVQLGSVTGGSQIETIGRVFGVYLLDPRTTRNPFKTPHRLTPDGIWCGYDHGDSVFIKYIPQCPQFTSTVWRSDVIYSKGELVYEPRIGECFKSKTANNLGHDPSVLVLPAPALTTEIIQDRAVKTAGYVTLPKIMDIFLAPTTTPIVITDMAVAQIDVLLPDGTLLGSVTHVVVGGDTLLTVLHDLRDQLIAKPLLSAYTITSNDLTLTIRIQGPSDFQIQWVLGVEHPFYWSTTAGIRRYFESVVIQPFIASVSPSGGQPQLTSITLTSDQVITGATYTVNIIGSDGVSHSVEYVSLVTDSVAQILAGLGLAITSSTDDPYFTSVFPLIDTVLGVLTLSTTDAISVDASVTVQASPYWETVLFPQVLADQVIRGEVADVLREEGQTDRADAEEQKVPTEMSGAASKFTTPDFLPLTDQQKPKSRFSIK